MRLFLLLFIGTIAFTAVAQDETTVISAKNDSIDVILPDTKYREDQFYASISYLLMLTQPQGYTQNSFSAGITTGFLRDMPVNDARTYAVAAGLGYAYYNIKHNLRVAEINSAKTYDFESTVDFDKNKQVLHYLELPIEFRWRRSNAISHKFLRIYTGFKISWLFADKAQYYPAGGGSEKVKNNDDLNKFVYGAYISAGWNTWNIYVHYGITPIYKSSTQTIEGQNIDLNMLNLGLIFYIL